MKLTRVMIVEDEALFREMLRHTLSVQLGLEIVAEASDGETAVQVAGKARPDVVLMDIELAGKMDGIEAALLIKKYRPKTGVVMLSAHGNWRYVTSLSLGENTGWAYLLKQTVPDLATIGRAIDGVRNGMVVIDPALTKDSRITPGSSLARLSQSKLEVLRLIAEGYNNVGIAKRLSLSVKSVENYINTIYQELGFPEETDVHARVKAALFYLTNS